MFKSTKRETWYAQFLRRTTIQLAKYIKYMCRQLTNVPCLYHYLWPWDAYMMTSSKGNISALLAMFARNSPVTGEFPTQRAVTRSFDVFFDLRLNKRLSKRSWGWLFETLSRLLWGYCSEDIVFYWRFPDLNILRSRQKCHHVADSIFKCIFLNTNVWIMLVFSLKSVSKSLINNISDNDLMPVRRQAINWTSDA